MNITADTNVLVRILTEDHPQQTEQAKAALLAAEMVSAPNVALCETAWVLRSGYGLSGPDLARILRSMVANPKIVVDHAAVRAGLLVLDGGGDFADGVIAHEGRRLGGETFVSFDRRAVKQLQAIGAEAKLLG